MFSFIFKLCLIRVIARQKLEKKLEGNTEKEAKCWRLNSIAMLISMLA